MQQTSAGISVSRNSKLPAPTAKDINEAHRLARATADSAIEHAVRCGQMLERKKIELDRGKFDSWVEKHCEFSRATAYNYIKHAKSGDLGAIRHLYDSGRSQSPPAKAGKSSNALDDSVKTAAEKAPFSAPESPPAPSQKQAESAPKDLPQKSVQGDVILAGESSKAGDPERSDWTDEEDAALASAEADMTRRLEAVFGADDKLAAAHAQLKQQSHLIGTLESTRDGFMRGKERITEMLATEQRKTAKLERENKKLREENESLRERIAIMEAS